MNHRNYLELENSLVVIGEKELKVIIAEAISEALNTRSEAKNDSKAYEYLNYKEAVAFLKVFKPTFTKIRSKFPSYKPCENRVLFKKSDLGSYLEICKE